MALILIKGKEAFEDAENSLKNMLDNALALGPGGGYFENVHSDFERIIKNHKQKMKQIMINADKASRATNPAERAKIQDVYSPQLSEQIKLLKKDLRCLIEAYDREFSHSRDEAVNIWAEFKDKLFEFMKNLIKGSGFYEPID